MSCIAWNCRGLGNSRAIRSVRNLVRSLVPELLFLIKTKKIAKELDSIKRACGYDNVFGVSCEGRKGGLALFWNKNSKVNLLSYSKNHIDVKVSLDEGVKEWRFTGFYGEPEASRRHLSWEVLRALIPKSNLPWLCCGDFNEIVSNTEKSGRKS